MFTCVRGGDGMRPLNNAEPGLGWAEKAENREGFLSLRGTVLVGGICAPSKI